MIINRDLITDVSTISYFSEWTGNTLYIYPKVQSFFSYEIENNIQTLLELTSEFTPKINTSRELVSTNTVESYFSGSLINLNYLNSLIPLFDPIPENVPVTLPHNFNDYGNKVPGAFEFYYNSHLYLTLLPPELGDNETYKTIQEKKYSRGNTLIEFHIDAWGDEDIFEYTFNDITVGQYVILEDFFQLTLGLLVTIKDHLGIERTGFIINPEVDFVAIINGYKVSFRFQQVS